MSASNTWCFTLSQGRSKSLTHIDTLGGESAPSMLGGSDDGGTEAGGWHGGEGGHLGVPDDPRRRKLSLHSKVSQV